MSVKENARQAWKEILGVVGVDSSKEKMEDDVFDESSETVDDAKGQGVESIYKGHSSVVQMHPVSVISDGMTVNGDAKVRGDLELRGAMKGNISADGNVTVTGKLLGDLRSTKDVILISAIIQGNVSAAGTIALDKASTVVGDIEAASATVDGKLKGSLVVEEIASFQKDAVLIGDVTAEKITMEEGSQVVGSIKINMEQVPTIEFKDLEL